MVIQAKVELRKVQLSAARNLNPKDREIQSRRIVEQIKSHPMWPQSDTVFGFMPMKDEPDLLPLLKDVLDLGKKLCLPRFHPEENTYKPAIIADMDRDLAPGKFGILEPTPKCSTLNSSHMDLTLVPGLAFDSKGWRLGRGKGFYDRVLGVLDGVRFGIALNHQWVKAVPHETLDQKMDWIITPSLVAKASD